MALEIKDANMNYGHAVRGMRVRKIGNYGRGRAKITIIMAVEAGDPDLGAEVEGSIERPRIWYRLSTDAGTSIENYVDFLNENLMDHFASGQSCTTT